MLSIALFSKGHIIELPGFFTRRVVFLASRVTTPGNFSEDTQNLKVLHMSIIASAGADGFMTSACAVVLCCFYTLLFTDIVYDR